MSTADYAEIVKQAEKAVASIKDGDLKTIAFGKILDTLLAADSGSTEQPSRAKSRHARRRKPTQSEAAKPDHKTSGGPKGYVEELIEEDFFDTPKTLASVRAELGNRGHHIPVTSLSRPMMILCQERRLRRQKAKDGKREVFTYSNW